MSSRAVLTTGHSTREIGEFISLLKAHGVQRVVDVRKIPKSGHNPQYSREALSAALHEAGLHYTHMPGLGGFRRPAANSVNTGWRNTSFRGYADYMLTPVFEKNLNQLIEFSEREQVAIMCAEAVPWRCHRSLIADALTVRGIEAREISSTTHTSLHELTSFARVEGREITYPSSEGTGPDEPPRQMSLLG